MSAPITTYPLKIQNIKSSDIIPPTHFNYLEYKVIGTAIQILIEHQCPNNPSFQALWDKTNNKFYLVGGKPDAPPEQVFDHVVYYSVAKTQQAWISVDLWNLNKKGILNIFLMGAIYRSNGSECEDRKPKLLMKVNL